MLEIHKRILEDIDKSLKLYGRFCQIPNLDFLTDTLASLEPQMQRMKKYAEDFDNAAKEYIIPATESFEIIIPTLQKIEFSLGDVRQKNIEIQKSGNPEQIVVAKTETEKIDKLINEIKELRQEIEKIAATKNVKTELPETFQLTVKDREIWINNFLLSKPHAVGTNFETLEFIRSKSANTPIKKSDLPNFLKEEIGGGSIADILYQLGFTKEILKAFFPKRSKKGMITYAGDKITKEYLQNKGINIALFMKQLEMAHVRNYPE